MSLKSRQARYPVSVMARARALSEATWTYLQIKQLLVNEFDVDPSLKTIGRWCVSEEVAARTRANHRAWSQRKREWAGYKPRPRSESWKLARMLELRAGGASYCSIAVCARVWFGDVLNADQVRYRLQKHDAAEALCSMLDETT